ncbi:Talin-2 [Liparis tanakae]|uniref:Talin-2 n=1 Tax=Liparis tanakae TaxID=230148 RepID=A0A4Z2GVC3_9TELE|nr:Talin-2 [Liparis tanakae]
MVRQARVLAQATSDLVNAMRSDAEAEVDGAAAYPENEDQQQRLREAAEGLRVATNAAAQNAIKKKLVNRLEVSLQSRGVLLSGMFDLQSQHCSSFLHGNKDVT